jgi:hypothetical protein
LEPFAVIIPIISIAIPFVIMFTTRGLNKGEKDRDQIRTEMDALAKEVQSNNRSLSILEERLKNHINGSKLTER